MKKYLFVEYRDAMGTGSEKLYANKSEAITAAAKAWDTLSEADRNSYKKDPAGTYRVDEIDITAEQFELYRVDELAIPLEELATATVWEAEIW
jgi:hypothetical protein